MSAVAIDISPDILRWVLRKNPGDGGCSILKKAEEWLDGTKKPSFAQLKELSRKTNIPFGYFFLSAPPDEENLSADFRTVGSIGVQNPSRNLTDTIESMDNVREWMAEYKRQNGIEAPAFSGKFSASSHADSIIASMREILDLPENWFTICRSSRDAFRTLRAKLESAGILVMQNGIVGNNTHRKLDVNEFRAFCLADPGAPLIFINTNDSDNGKIFSLAHESAHVWTGENDFFDGGKQNISGRLETLCNKVASEILVPAAILLQKWSAAGVEIDDRVSALSRVFHCSTIVVLRKALETGLISREQFVQYDHMYAARTESGSSRKAGTGGNYYHASRARWSSQLILALDKSARSGNTLYRDVYKLTGMTGKTFSRLVQEIEGA